MHFLPGAHVLLDLLTTNCHGATPRWNTLRCLPGQGAGAVQDEVRVQGTARGLSHSRASAPWAMPAGGRSAWASRPAGGRSGTLLLKGLVGTAMWGVAPLLPPITPSVLGTPTVSHTHPGR